MREFEQSRELPLPDTDQEKAEEFLKNVEFGNTKIEGTVLKNILIEKGVENVGTVNVVWGRTPDDIIFFKDEDGVIKHKIYRPSSVFTKKEVNNIVAFGESQDSRFPSSSAKKLDEIISNLQGK